MNKTRWTLAGLVTLMLLLGVGLGGDRFPTRALELYISEFQGSAITQDWTEITKLLASDGAAEDLFGVSVALNGNTAVVGTPIDDDNGARSGSAYIFERTQSGGWKEVKKLVAPDGATRDKFGYSVAISGDIVVIGAPQDDLEVQTGTAYVFERNQGGMDNWGVVKRLLASDGDLDDRFGFSVAISDNTIVVGAYHHDANGDASGAAYVFERNWDGTNGWGQVKKLTASDGESSDLLGYSVAISGDTAIVGAHGSDDRGAWTGAAYVFERDQGGSNNWGETRKLVATDGVAEDYFGFSVAGSGNVIVVGAPGDADNGNNAGSAYVFERNQGGVNNWGEVKKLRASDGEAHDSFGLPVAVSGNTVAIGAHYEGTNGYRAGAAYVFGRNQNGADLWGELGKLLPTDGASEDLFGFAVSISGDTIIGGAHNDDDNGENSGAAYVFQVGPLSDQELAQRYAPYLFRHEHETYWPLPVEPVVQHSVLQYPGGWERLLDPNQLADPLYNYPTSYLDLPGDSKEQLANYFQAVWDDPEWQPHAYARVYKNPVNPENIVIQYWFYYWDNPSLNHHEGDWEMVQVVLDSGVPVYAVYSQHEWGGKRFWKDVEKVGGTHPVVYVARGSHASYFKPYRHWVDSTGTTPIRSSQPISFTMIPTGALWLDFRGYWGKFKDDNIPWNDGPKGPKLKEIKWNSPMLFAQNAEWDEISAKIQAGKFVASIGATYPFPLPNDVHVYKRTPGGDPHVGWRDGTIELGIPDAEYFDNPEAMRRTIILHKVLPTSHLYRVEFDRRPSGQVMYQRDTISTTWVVTLTLNYPDPDTGVVITSTYTVSKSWGISSTTSISVYSGSDLYLNLDMDGDGVFEESVPPTTLEQIPYDFVAPATITDLVVLESTTDYAVLAWTAPGDDGNTGTAPEYDVRHYTRPLTDSNWVSATHVISSPVPSVAGTTEVMTVTGLHDGYNYFAVQAMDDRFRYSEISNVAKAKIVFPKIFKSVEPKGEVDFGDVLTYTLTISGMPGTELSLYDPLMSTNFVSFVNVPDSVTHTVETSGILKWDIITGTVTITADKAVEVTFAVQVPEAGEMSPGSTLLVPFITNQACIYPKGGELSKCVWSDVVINAAHRIYLPLLLRS